MEKSINNGLITSGQSAKMLFHFALGTASLILPTTVAIISKQDVWLSYLLSIPLALGFLWIYMALAGRFPGMSLVQYAEQILGPWLGRVVAFSYLLFFLILSALVLRNITDFLSVSFLPRTPPWFTGITFMIVIVYGARLGIETIGRTSEMLFMWGLFLLGATVLLTLHQIRFDNFEPVLYEGWLRPIRGLYPMLGFPMAECVFLTMILPSVRGEDRSKLKKSIFRIMIFSGLTSLLIAILVLGMLGLNQMERSPFAVFDMAQNIKFQNQLLRIEVTVTIIWVSSVFMKLLLCVYVLSRVTAQIFRLPDYRQVVIPFATLIIPFSLVAYRDSTEVQRFTLGAWMPYSLLHGFVLPALLLIVAVLAGKRNAGEDRPDIQELVEGGSPHTQASFE